MPLCSQLSDPHAVFDAVLSLAADSGHIGDLLKLLHHLMLLPAGTAGNPQDSMWPMAVNAVEHMSDGVRT